MGYTASGAFRQCFETGLEATVAWCDSHEAGSTSTSCKSDSCTYDGALARGICTTFRTPTGSTTQTTATRTVYVSECDVPTPVQDAVVFSSAVVAMWVTVAAAMFLYRFFRVPHADSL